tara:strand:+ start:3255 stop:4184 length:930 start_codon:yes stop_codon:yes gene_type:complete
MDLSPEEIRIKIVSNYGPHNLKDHFSRMCKDPKNLTWNNLRIVEKDEDVAVVINWVEHGIVQEKKSIVLQMEPSFVTQKFPSVFSNLQDHKNEFLFAHDTQSHHNNIEWHISPTYSQLINNEINLDKEYCFSTVMSGKRDCSLHVKRLDFLCLLCDNLIIDVWGKGHSDKWIGPNAPSVGREMGELPLREKDRGLFPYKYTYASENNIERNYFTEKIVDSILSECLCFYYGCPNIDDFIHPQSYINIDLEDFEGSLEVIKSAIENNEWEKRLLYIRESKDKILNELQMFPVLEKVLNSVAIKMEDLLRS